ncbi:MAG: hypothetical protein E7292_11300 [Lachnospiraceae bacterium]|nr:hypothetical protein [Lachnospiraceae bacterium]
MEKGKRWLAAIIIAVGLFTLCGCNVKEKLTADYANQFQAADAFLNGEDVVGKTMIVVAEFQSYGMISREPYLEERLNVDVLLVEWDDSLGKYVMCGEDNIYSYINEGDIIKVEIVEVTDHYEISFLCIPVEE